MNKNLHNSKKFRLTSLIFLMAMLFTSSIYAKDYDLWIGGERVKSSNLHKLHEFDCVKSGPGSVKFDPSTSTLTLDNASIEAYRHTGMVAKINNLKIKVIGYCRLTTKSKYEGYRDDAIKIEKATVIEGTGDDSSWLDVISYHKSGIYLVKATLTVRNCKLSVTGLHNGIDGYKTGTNGEVVTIDNSTASFWGQQKGSFQDIQMLIIKGDKYEINYPEGAYYDASKRAIVDKDKKKIEGSKVAISKYYGIKVGGTKVTSYNAKNLAPYIHRASGDIYYTPFKKTLTLKDATINSSYEGILIGQGIHDTKIELKGANTITVNKPGFILPGIMVDSDITIGGAGTLTINSKYGIQTGDYRNLTIKDCNLNINNNITEDGIAYSGYYDEMPGSLIVDNANIKVKGGVYNYEKITLKNCYIDTPVNASYSSGDVKVAGNLWKGLIEIKKGEMPNYGIFIKGIPVNTNNATDVLGDGKVSYNHSTKTLTLNNATITSGENQNGIEIKNKSGEYFIKLIGNNKITSSGNDTFDKDNAILSYANLTISGSGSLIAKSENNTGIYLWKANLTIKDCTVEATGNYGISGQSRATDKLLIDNANVKAKGRSGGNHVSIGFFKTITLKNCHIASPANADYSSGDVKVNDKIYTGLVEIKKGSDNTGITEQEAAKLVTIYPNPAQSIVNVELAPGIQAETLSITDLTGKLLYTQSLTEDKTSIDVSNFATGVYILRVGNVVRKLTVKH